MKAKFLLIAGAAFAGGLLLGQVPARHRHAPPVPLSPVDVRRYGAKGDGKADDTAAFAEALEAAEGSGGAVTVPAGTYRIASHLEIPDGVTLEGVWKMPPKYVPGQGTILLAEEGAGSESGTAFITLHANSAIKGISIFYPGQSSEAPKPYPWCVQCAGGDNASIIDCMLVNPYQAVDFGTNPSGRHYIRGLYGQPLRRGIFIDKCYDVGRIENVHFWPFWSWGEKSPLARWMWQNGEAFIFGRTDWEAVLDTFAFGYKVGYKFIKTPDGSMNGSLVGIGSDASHTAVLVEACQNPGLQITNGEFVSLAEPNPTEVVTERQASGPVLFQNCAFWGPADQIARLGGSGTVSFNGCNFVEWDRMDRGLAAIDVLGGGVIVNGCTFQKAAPQLMLRDRAESASVVGNRMSGKLALANPAHADLQAGFNTLKRPPARPREEAGAIVVDDADGPPVVVLEGPWISAPGAGNYLDEVRFAVKGVGAAVARFHPGISTPGRYRVSIYVGPDPNNDHASNMPVTIHAQEGSVTKRVNLRGGTGAWVALGSYRLGPDSTIELTNNADGNVLADAVKVTPEP